MEMEGKGRDGLIPRGPGRLKLEGELAHGRPSRTRGSNIQQLLLLARKKIREMRQKMSTFREQEKLGISAETERKKNVITSNFRAARTGEWASERGLRDFRARENILYTVPRTTIFRAKKTRKSL